MSNLINKFTFDRFVVGPCNQFAHAAAVAVAEQPAKNYNPLFIYGGVGLGKTHLLNAIGFHALSLHKDMNVVYVSAEEFMNELINSIRYDGMPKFREKYRNLDCLLIDDIQFMAGKERTQEEFFHTFNTLHDSGKQIVIACDKFPKDIPNLQDKLCSRCQWGLIVDINPPEIETRIAIIKKKIQENNFPISDNIAHYIASHKEDANINEMEGFLIRIDACASLTGREINLDLVKELEQRQMLEVNKMKEIDPSSYTIHPSFSPIKEIITDEIKNIENIQRSGRCITGIPTGFDRLDNLTSGLQGGNLIVVAGRPVMGKTAFALAIARNAALLAEAPVAIFSMETAKEKLVQRMLSMEAKLDSRKFRTGDLSEDDWPKLTQAAARLSKAPIFISDYPGITVQEMTARIKQMKESNDIKLIIVDYLQLMKDDRLHYKRGKKISEICQSLKDLARELCLPIVILSQVTRMPEYRSNHRPCIGDLPGSGVIERDADVILFIYRDEVYDRSEDNPERGIAEIIIAKQRNGPTGLVKLAFDEKYSCFTNLPRTVIDEHTICDDDRTINSENYE